MNVIKVLRNSFFVVMVVAQPMVYGMERPQHDHQNNMVEYVPRRVGFNTASHGSDRPDAQVRHMDIDMDMVDSIEHGTFDVEKADDKNLFGALCYLRGEPRADLEFVPLNQDVAVHKCLAVLGCGKFYYNGEVHWPVVDVLYQRKLDQLNPKDHQSLQLRIAYTLLRWLTFKPALQPDQLARIVRMGKGMI